jgi:hypothetical protein
MIVDNIYYVYQYIREDNSPSYIGMGHGSRIHDPHKGIKVPKRKFRQLLQENMEEKDALILEGQLTRKYGLIIDGSGILENKIHGGHASPRGMLGKKHSDITRLKISSGNKGKVRTEEHKENYRKPKTAEHAEKIRQANLNRPKDDRYNQPFANRGKPWTQARRDAHNLRKNKDNTNVMA